MIFADVNGLRGGFDERVGPRRGRCEEDALR